MYNTKKDQADSNLAWVNFNRIFPDMAAHVLSHERSGSKMIKLAMDDGTTLFFMYYTPTNWNLGTKPWRLKPKDMIDKPAELDINEEEHKNDNA